MKFIKYHALGNDYIVVDPTHETTVLSEERIRRICDRHFGIGSDGILYGPLVGEDGINLRIFNPDGSEAEKSGNGIRIFSKYLMDAGYIQNPRFTVKTLGGEAVVDVQDADSGMIEVDMGPVSFQSSEIPVLGEIREVIDEPVRVGGKEYRMTCLTIGNPHCIVPLKKVSAELACAAGPAIEILAMFPNRTNVQFVQRLDGSNIRIEIWERGAGYTLASGSSACAAFAAVNRLGLVGKKGRVHMPGGTLDVHIDQKGRLHQTGPAVKVMEGTVVDDIFFP
ncbi:MAG: diaminopimelate epimerase [Spirochaetes bacterium]|nr:diaminopimelate epimerase [Spirochaetota bacterium]